VTENGGDIVGEVRGIKGFKAYLATHVSYLEDLSLIQEMAIFACPTLETIIGLSDLILQVTFNLLTSTYKPF
jgi:hypothetical protein